MAYKNVFRLTSRRQGEIIGQIYKFICCYSDFFVSRTRVYIKEIAQNPDSIYWLENPKTGEVTSLALVEPKYNFEVDNIKFVTIGHTMSKMNNQMHNILDHLFGDYNDSNILIFSRTLLAAALDIRERYGFVEFEPEELENSWSNLANFQSDYFNVHSGDSIANGAVRKGYNLYLKITPKTLEYLKVNNAEVFAIIDKKMKELISEEDKTESINEQIN
jgi:hypothetical protein